MPAVFISTLAYIRIPLDKLHIDISALILNNATLMEILREHSRREKTLQITGMMVTHKDSTVKLALMRSPLQHCTESYVTVMASRHLTMFRPRTLFDVFFTIVLK